MNSMCQISEETVNVIEAVNNEHVGIIFDPANLRTNGELDWKTALRRQADYIRHVHVKDFRYFKNGKSFPVLVGEGDMPWQDIIKNLFKYSRRIGIIHGKIPEFLPTCFPEVL